MRSFSLTAFTALLFVVVVSAAPRQSPQINIEDVIFDGLDLEDGIMFDKVLKVLKCMRDVTGNIIGDSDLKPLYEEYKLKAEATVKNKLMKCRDRQGNLLCIVNALHKISIVYDEFYAKVAMKNKDLVDKMQKEIKTKCAYTEINLFEIDTYEPSIREQFFCQIKALEEASMKNGMSTEWKKYEMKFKQTMDAWKQCDNLNDILKKIWCNIKEGATINGHFIGYTKSIAGHPNFQKFAQDFWLLIQKCKV